MDIDLIKPQVFDSEGTVRALFTLKNAGFSGDGHAGGGLDLGTNTATELSQVAANRRHLFEAESIDPGWVAFAEQVHSNRVTVVTEGGTYAATDGLVTAVPGLTLAIQVADCAAVLIADPESVTVAALHAGWRGAAGNIVPRGLDKMAVLGARPGRCRAFISPCISQEAFEVGTEVAEQFPDEFVDYRHYEKPHVDLKGFLRHQLEAAGLQRANIEIEPGCTFSDAQYNSYRREKEQSGRMLAVIQGRRRP